MHDLNFEHYPEDTPLLARKFYRKYFPLYAKKAIRIATVSEFTKKDITEQYGIAANGIDVVGNGANTLFAPSTEEDKINTRKKYSSGCPYFLYVGALHPRKNIPVLLKAFDEFRKEFSSTIKLIIAGGKMWKNEQLEEVYDSMQFRDEVIFTGRLSTDELKDVLASAMALSYIPYFEGFGIPIVEAMYSGVPVITSNVTAMPEVAGEAALLVDPRSVDSVKDAMMRIVKDEKLRKELILKGEIRKKDFSWDRTAELLWKCILKTV